LLKEFVKKKIVPLDLLDFDRSNGCQWLWSCLWKPS